MREPATVRLTAADAEQTRGVGWRLGKALLLAGLREPLRIALEGELGAGKSTLVAGLLGACGHLGPVPSPTYTLIEPYRLAGRAIYHCDLYRLESPEAVEDLGLRELVAGDSVLLVEWPERAGRALGRWDVVVRLEYEGDGRRITLAAHTPAGHRVLDGLHLGEA